MPNAALPPSSKEVADAVYRYRCARHVEKSCWYPVVTVSSWSRRNGKSTAQSRIEEILSWGVRNPQVDQGLTSPAETG